MPSKKIKNLVKEIKKCGIGEKMSKREFIWLFDEYEKRSSGNVWRINEYLKEQKMVVTPSYQGGWIDEIIELKEKPKAKITNGENESSDFDPINRLSILEAASKTPISVKPQTKLKEAYFLMWENDFSQLPVMNKNKDISGLISWQSISKGLIANNKSDLVKDYMSKDFTILDENTPLFEAIKKVIDSEIIFVKDKEKYIKGPVTPSDLNEQFIEQIEPYILLEQIENFVRILLHDKIILDDILKLLNKDKTRPQRSLESISEMTFGEYLLVLQNNEMWEQIGLPFDKALFFNSLDSIREIRNSVMHFHPDGTTKSELETLRRTSDFLMDYVVC